MLYLLPTISPSSLSNLANVITSNQVAVVDPPVRKAIEPKLKNSKRQSKRVTAAIITVSRATSSASVLHKLKTILGQNGKKKWHYLNVQNVHKEAIMLPQRQVNFINGFLLMNQIFNDQRIKERNANI
jgi:hypothetical protein